MEPDRRVLRVTGYPKVEIPYDYLVLATGVTHAYFGNPHWEALAPGLKTIEDALEIRRRFLLAFEAAEIEGRRRGAARGAHLRRRRRRADGRRDRRRDGRDRAHRHPARLP